MGERGGVCVMRSPPVRGVGGGCRRVGLERRVLLAASSHLEVPARGTTQSRRERGGGRRDGGSGGPTRWGERGAAENEISLGEGASRQVAISDFRGGSGGSKGNSEAKVEQKPGET